MDEASQIQVPIAPGELIDKITILEIKSDRISDAEKLTNVRRELGLLVSVRDAHIAASPEIEELSRSLKSVNERIWDIEDRIRDLERDKDFGDDFVQVARSVYMTNDERAALKKQINIQLGSGLIEEKSYQPY